MYLQSKMCATIAIIARFEITISKLLHIGLKSSNPVLDFCFDTALQDEAKRLGQTWINMPRPLAIAHPIEVGEYRLAVEPNSILVSAPLEQCRGMVDLTKERSQVERCEIVQILGCSPMREGRRCLAHGADIVRTLLFYFLVPAPRR